MSEVSKSPEHYSDSLLICQQVSHVQSVCSNWCAVFKSLIEIVLLPLGYFHSGTHVNYNTSGCITNGCVFRDAKCGESEASCSDGEYALP
jgi:hypothetical protein